MDVLLFRARTVTIGLLSFVLTFFRAHFLFTELLQVVSYVIRRVA